MSRHKNLGFIQVISEETTVEPKRTLPPSTEKPRVRNTGDWKKFKNSEYYWLSPGVSSVDGKKSWHDANGWCMKNGGWLLKLDTKEEGHLVATEVELQN